MDVFAFGYQRIHETSWAWLSSLLMLALFFKFNRFWSIRNLDLVLLILLAPGILMVGYRGDGQFQQVRDGAETGVLTESLVSGELENGHSDPAAGPAVGQSSEASFAAADRSGSQPPVEGLLPENVSTEAASQQPVSMTELDGVQLIQRAGYIWLFSCGGLWLLRMLLDPLFVRRPLLEPNLTVGGLVFLGCSLLTFIFADIVTSRPGPGSLDGAIGAMKILNREAAGDDAQKELIYHAPGYALLHVIPAIPTFSAAESSASAGGSGGLALPLQLEIAAKTLTITGQIAMVFGLVAIGFYHFSSFRTGVGIAVIWLMLPYTIMYSGSAYHVLPAALIVWAVVLYRQPLVAGVMLGLATGVSYYPLFLLPLWLSFYWETRVARFVTGYLLAIAVCVGGLVFTSESGGHFFQQLQAMFGFWLPRMDRSLLQGIWVLGWDPWFRVPVLVAFVVLSVSFVFWPAEKNLGTLIAYTSAVMIAVQFWHGYQGGTFMAWYLPLVLATMFRPNLSDRMAMTQTSPWRKKFRVDSAQRISPAA